MVGKTFLMVLVTISTVYNQSLSPETSWACGVFITGGDGLLSAPQGQYYELPSLQAECPAKFRDTWKRGTFAKKCGRLGSEWEANWVSSGGAGAWELAWSPLGSILSTGRFSQDACSIIKQELGIENVPGEEIEMPFQFGYFYKYCGKEEWKDTGVKSTSLICCQNGIGVDCSNIPPAGEDRGSNEVDQAGAGAKINGEVSVDSNGQLEASPSDSDSSSSYGGSSSSQSSSNGGGASSGSKGETISGSEEQDVRSKIDQLRSVATLLKRKADQLEASL